VFCYVHIKQIDTHANKPNACPHTLPPLQTMHVKNSDIEKLMQPIAVCDTLCTCVHISTLSEKATQPAAQASVPVDKELKCKLLIPFCSREREPSGNVTVKSCLNCAQPLMVHYAARRPALFCGNVRNDHEGQGNMDKGENFTKKLQSCIPFLRHLCTGIGSLSFCRWYHFPCVSNHGVYCCLC